MVVLAAAVALATAASAAAFSASAVLAKEITGSDGLAGIAAAGLTVGAAVGAVPLARMMNRSGRRPGMRLALWFSALGGLMVAAAAVAELYPVVVLGTITIGISNAVALAARFAAADLAEPSARGRAIGIVIWTATVGAVLGPIVALAGAEPLAVSAGLPEFVGIYLFTAAILVAAALVVEFGLRPDPLLLARERGGITEPPARGSVADGWRSISGARRVLIGTVTMVTAHVVMVSIMTVTPLHIGDGTKGLEIIGYVISVHIIGMYGFSPVMGWLTDRVGPSPVIIAGGVILLAAAELAASSDPGDRPLIFIALFLLGLGWSAELVAGSSLITGELPLGHRVGAQGVADLAMNTFGATAGIGAGFVLGWQSFALLGHVGAVLAAAVILAGFVLGRRPRPRHAEAVEGVLRAS